MTQDRFHISQTCGKRSNGAALGPPAAVVGAGVDGVGIGAGTAVESGGGAEPPIPGITGAISDVFGIP
jgi:hypothetical protein